MGSTQFSPTNTAGKIIYSDTVDTFSFNTNFSTKMVINGSGNVGINATNPGSKLQVDGEIDANGGDGYRINGKPWASESSNNLRLGDWDGEGFTTTIYDDTSAPVVLVGAGKVGIGTNNPNRLLTVETTGNASYLALNSSSNNTTIGSDVNGAFIVYDDSSATYRMVIDQTTGNIGVNTTNPYAKLHVASTSSNNVPTAGTATGGLWVSTSSKTFGINMGVSGSGWGFIQSQRADTGTALYNLNLQPLGGNVGIGTDSPNAKLEVAGYTRITGGGLDVGYGNNGTNFVQVGWGRTTNGYALIDLIGDDFYDDYGFRIIRNNSGQNTDTDILHRGTGDLDLKTIDAGDIGFHTTSVQRMIVKSSGNVGIGDSNPDAKLEIAGHSTSGKFLLIDAVAPGETFLDVEDGQNATLFSITRETGNTIKFNSFNDFSFADNISVTGTVTATNFILSSDETLKDNIKEIDVKHTDVNWKNFELKSEPGIKRAGVIAQELEVKHPEFVRTASDGIKSVAYIDLLITKIAELEARLEKAGL